MAIKYMPGGLLIGLAGDTKPVLPADGLFFIEEDTGKLFKITAGSWAETSAINTVTQTALDAKQATLVSATNIKTINGATVLGSGDLVVSGEGGVSDGDKGNITVTDTGTTWTIDANAVTNAQAAQMATKTYKGRTTAGTGDSEDVAVATLKTDLGLVKGDVGLGSVDNTTDAGKPVSTAQQTALDLKANLAGPTFTGTVTLPAGTVTKAMQENMATASLVYRKTAGAGAPEINTLATVKTDLLLTGTNSGDQTTIVGITGTIAEFNTAITDGNLATGGGTATGTNTGDQTLPTDATIVTTDVTTNNTTTSKHGWFPKLPTATGLFLKDDLTWAAPGGVSDGDKGDITVTVSGGTWTIDAGTVTEAKQVLADNTTNDVSITKHGYVPKAPNIATQFLNGTGVFSVPAGGGGSGISLGLAVATIGGLNLS